MIKKLLIITVVLLLTTYVVMAMTWFNKEPADAMCRDIEVRIQNNKNHTSFITTAELQHMLQKSGITVKGKKMSEINCRNIEKQLQKSPFIEKVECYKSPSHKVCVEVKQRAPILRIIADNGEQYYIDHLGSIIPHSGYAVHLPVVTGAITKKNADQLLGELSRCIQNNPFWENQIEQIHVTPSQELEMITRVGNHVVFLGKPKNIENKLERLKTFYQKALNKVGWNKYVRINLEFTNQIICTKKEK